MLSRDRTAMTTSFDSPASSRSSIFRIAAWPDQHRTPEEEEDETDVADDAAGNPMTPAPTMVATPARTRSW